VNAELFPQLSICEVRAFPPPHAVRMGPSLMVFFQHTKLFSAFTFIRYPLPRVTPALSRSVRLSTNGSLRRHKAFLHGVRKRVHFSKTLAWARRASPVRVRHHAFRESFIQKTLCTAGSARLFSSASLCHRSPLRSSRRFPSDMPICFDFRPNRPTPPFYFGRRALFSNVEYFFFPSSKGRASRRLAESEARSSRRAVLSVYKECDTGASSLPRPWRQRNKSRNYFSFPCLPWALQSIMSLL